MKRSSGVDSGVDSGVEWSGGGRLRVAPIICPIIGLGGGRLRVALRVVGAPVTPDWKKNLHRLSGKPMLLGLNRG